MYRVICKNFLQSLVDQVEAALAQGWHCQGGIMFDGNAFYQAMIKE